MGFDKCTRNFWHTLPFTDQCEGDEKFKLLAFPNQVRDWPIGKKKLIANCSADLALAGAKNHRKILSTKNWASLLQGRGRFGIEAGDKTFNGQV